MLSVLGGLREGSSTYLMPGVDDDVDVLVGEHEDTRRSEETVSEFGNRWIDERSGLSTRTVGLYRSLMRLHIMPQLGNKQLRQVDAGMVRTWRQGLLDGDLGASTVDKAYRLLRSIFATAVDDGALPATRAGSAVQASRSRRSGRS